MSFLEPPDKLGNSDRIEPTRPIDKETHAPDTAKIPFSEYMNEKENLPVAESKGPSPYEPTVKAGIHPSPTPETLQNQMTAAKGSLDTVKTHLDYLHSKQATLPPSQQSLLRNQLGEASGHLRSVAAKTGVPVPDLEINPNRQNPVERFLSMVTGGQQLLNGSMAKISQMQLNPGQYSAPDFLSIQAQMMRAQQCLDYSSVLLGKAVASLKELYGTQF